MPPLGGALTYFDFLPSHDLVIWTDGSFFPFGKSGSGVLTNCSLCDTEATLSFWQVQFVQVFPLKTAQFYKPFSGLGTTNKSDIPLSSSSPTLALSLPPCPLLRLFFRLNFSGRSGRNCFLSSLLLSGFNRFLDTSIYHGATRLLSWPGGLRHYCSVQSFVVPISYLSYSLFSLFGLEAYRLI